VACLRCCLLVVGKQQELPGPGRSRCREVAVQLAGSAVPAGRLQPSLASLGDHRCSQDDDKYRWPACFELRHDISKGLWFMSK
jgi:hypothetical protein